MTMTSNQPIVSSTTSARLATTEDAFLGGQLSIRQVRDGSRAGVDAVFLAAACPARAGQTVLEAGTGSGVVALAVAHRVANVAATGVEIDAELAALARENAVCNNLADRVRIIEGDVTAPASAIAAQGLPLESFNHVLANPPFLEASEARVPPGARLARAHALEAGDLERWVRFLAAFCAPKGMATIVHRADALPRLLAALEGRFGGVVVYPLFPRPGEPATRVLVQGKKGSRAPFCLAQGMVLHAEGNAFTPEAQAVLRHGQRLELLPQR
ncbi:MAG: methyltransferase [Alphaproteobacteria bacterium]